MYLSFVLNNDSVEKKINVKQALFFSFLKKPGLRNLFIIYNYENELFDSCVNKNEAINILGF